MGVRINQVEFRETVRAYFPQGQSKLSVIMRRLYKEVSLKRSLTVLRFIIEYLLYTVLSSRNCKGLLSPGTKQTVCNNEASV